ncbi:hypothetical protein VNO77_18606 [Canavalia gladiata]|uniref:Uncharacterized protein n=1 Tax=Canavalia gladiata TaxID=3824 RepID=A0AAN9LL87_CANGL
MGPLCNAQCRSLVDKWTLRMKTCVSKMLGSVLPPYFTGYLPQHVQAASIYKTGFSSLSSVYVKIFIPQHCHLPVAVFFFSFQILGWLKVLNFS